jgi:hypothetical protein
VTENSAAVEGWYRDPYGIHQDRWFSAGTPTALIRDQGTEGHDDPPGYPPPEPPVEIPDTDRFPADDFRRADDAEANAEYGGGFPGDDFRRADEAEARPGRGDQETAAERAFNAEVSGFAGDENA